MKSLSLNMIPDFDHNNVLPPTDGNPAIKGNLSPYKCTSIELATRFSTTDVRIRLLINLFNFRTDLRAAGLTENSFQWIDGSFVEHKEVILNEPPGDIDVLTFYHGYDEDFLKQLVSNFSAFNNRKLARESYLLDHIPLNLNTRPIVLYEMLCYWTMLFNHSRQGVWKGILLLDLNTPDDDRNALDFLNNL